MNTTDDQFSDRLLAYEKAVERGESLPVEHEYLRSAVESKLGISAGQFFDKYGQAPYFVRDWLGWPVRQYHYYSFVLTRIGLAAFVATALILLIPVEVGAWTILVALLGGFLAWKFLLRLVMSLPFIQPKNMTERVKRAAEYRALCEAEEDAERKQAESDRRNRLYDDNN